MDRDKLIGRIRKLFALANDRAATVEEAATAAGKAREMMREHGIDQVDLDAAEMASEEVALNRKKRTRMDNLIMAVAYATGTVPMLMIRDSWRTASYFGPAPAPIIASYLHDLCYRAVQSEVKAFRKSPEYLRRRKANTRAKAAYAFREHMILVIRHRLLQLGWLTREEQERLAQHRDSQLQQRGYGLAAPVKRMKKPKHSARFDDAATAGAIAGASFQIEQGLSGDPQERKAIGG